MPLETATFIADLVVTNPPTSDLETQGANHLTLIKTVLQNVFGTSVRRYVGLPGIVTLSASSGIAANSAGFNILINTAAGALTMTLPTLLATDAGWEVTFLKTTTDVNPFFILPPSGTIQSGEYTGLTKARRCIPGRRTRVVWTGSAFICERVDYRPIGTVFDCIQAAAPVGYERATGAVLSSAANYPEYFAIFGSGNTPDLRGRATFGLDNVDGAGNSGRITVAGGNYDGTSNQTTGGLQNHTQTQAEMPAHTHPSPSLADPGHGHATTPASPNVGVTASGAGFTTGNSGPFGNSQNLTINNNTTGISLGANTGSQGSGTPFPVLPPSMVMPKYIVVE